MIKYKFTHIQAIHFTSPPVSPSPGKAFSLFPLARGKEELYDPEKSQDYF